jgi:hypothetical protein
MKLLAIERDVPGVADREFAQYLKAEALVVWRLIQEGLIREAYFSADRDAAVLVLESPDTDAANATLATLPLVRAGLIAFEVVPLIAYPGFARLFSAEVLEDGV